MGVLLAWHGLLPAAARAAVAGPMEEIIVVASKAARPLHTIPAQVTRVDRARLEFEQTQEVADIARYEPAIEADFNAPRFGSTGISIRGIGGNRVALEFDGVPLPQQYAVGNFAESGRLAVDPAIIERIEILRGPASALYGSDAIGGVVAVTSVDGADLVGAGRRQHLGARAGYFGGNDAWLASAVHAWSAPGNSTVAALSRRRGDEPDNRARGVADDRIDFEQWQAFGKWTHELPFDAELRLSLDYFERNTLSDVRSLLGYQRFATTTSLRGDDQQRRERETVSLTFADRAWFDELVLMVYRQSNTTTQDTAERRSSRGRAVALQRDFALRELDYGGELRFTRGFTTAALEHLVVAGVEWDHQRLSESRDGGETDLGTGTRVRAILGETFPARDLPKSVLDEIGIYLQDEITFGALSVVGALRWDDFALDARTDDIFTDSNRITDLDTDQVSFRVGASLWVVQSMQLYAHYAEGFRAPPPGDVNLLLDLPLFNYRAIPNPDLRPEQSSTFEAGWRFHRLSTALEGAVYYTDYDNFIESRANLGIDPASGALLFQSRNLERAHIYGLEVSLRQQLDVLHAALSAFRFDAGFHFARGENDVSNRPLNEVSPLKASFALRWEAPNRSLSAALRVVHLARQGRVDFSAMEFFVPPAATTLDFTVQWRPHSGVQTEFGVYNLANQRYWRYADVRRYALDDPRVEILSRPGTHAQLTISLTY